MTYPYFNVRNPMQEPLHIWRELLKKSLKFTCLKATSPRAPSTNNLRQYQCFNLRQPCTKSLLLSYSSSRHTPVRDRSPWNPSSLNEVNSLIPQGCKTLSPPTYSLSFYPWGSCPFTECWNESSCLVKAYWNTLDLTICDLKPSSLFGT